MNLKMYLFAALLFPCVVTAQQPQMQKPHIPQTFKLYSPKPEVEIIQCFSKQAAIDIADAGNREARTAVFLAHFREGSCVWMTSVATYYPQVYRNGAYRVYVGRIGSITVYTPTDWIAEGETDL